MKSLLCLLLLCLVALTGCATSPQESALQPNESLANAVLSRDTLGMLKLFENAHQVAGTPRVVGKKLVQPQNAKGVWIEDWTIQRSDHQVVYTVTFMPSPGGGTDFSISSQPRRL